MTPLGDAFVCPVCGYPGLHAPPYDPALGRKDPSYEICPCCWFEYGVTDLDRGFTHEQWRTRWIAEGMPWRSPVEGDGPPPGWDPGDQLRRVVHRESIGSSLGTAGAVGDGAEDDADDRAERQHHPDPDDEWLPAWPPSDLA